jgi:hypothetical protein
MRLTQYGHVYYGDTNNNRSTSLFVGLRFEGDMGILSLHYGSGEQLHIPFPNNGVAEACQMAKTRIKDATATLFKCDVETVAVRGFFREWVYKGPLNGL